MSIIGDFHERAAGGVGRRGVMAQETFHDQWAPTHPVRYRSHGDDPDAYLSVRDAERRLSRYGLDARVLIVGRGPVSTPYATYQTVDCPDCHSESGLGECPRCDPPVIEARCMGVECKATALVAAGYTFACPEHVGVALGVDDPAPVPA